MPAPIGVFDSGIGGVSILAEIRQLLPHENIIYLADSAYCPYGTKSVELIRERTLKVTGFLTANGAKAVVVACNTACSAGLDQVRISNPHIPIVGVEPAVKPAHNITRNGKIGVLSTNLTLQGQKFSILAEQFGNGVEILTQSAPGLADLVDSGKKDDPETIDLLNRYLEPLLEHEIDTLVLGCTHYPFLKKTIAKICGPDVIILDTGLAVARQTERVLRYKGILNTDDTAGKINFHTTGDAISVKKVLESVWNEKVESITHVTI